MNVFVRTEANYLFKGSGFSVDVQLVGLAIVVDDATKYSGKTLLSSLVFINDGL